MRDRFNSLQDQYQTLIARAEKIESDETFLGDVRSFISDAKRAGATIPDLNERSQLRAWMRFLASLLYDAAGVYPDITLQPLTEGQLVGPKAEPSETPPAPRRLAWTLLGGAIVLLAGCPGGPRLAPPRCTCLHSRPCLHLRQRCS